MSEFQASVRRVEAAINRTNAAQEELERARHEQTKIVTDYFVECGGHPARTVDYNEPCQDGDTLLIKSTADELFIKAGDGCTIIFFNKIGTVRIEQGDGAIVMFEASVGGANINQGHGGDVILEEAPDSLDVNQGAGSMVTIEGEDD